MNPLTMVKYAEMVRKVSETMSPQRAEKCGYDLLMGLAKNDAEDRYKAWQRYMDEPEDGGHVDEERDGCWVPAIEYKPK